jgi:hypothetical protein
MTSLKPRAIRLSHLVLDAYDLFVGESESPPFVRLLVVMLTATAAGLILGVILSALWSALWGLIASIVAEVYGRP